MADPHELLDEIVESEDDREPGLRKIEPINRGTMSGKTRLSFRVLDDGRLFIDNIDSTSTIPGWGTALVLYLIRSYPDQKVWVVKSVKESGVGFWEKIRERHGITLILEFGNSPITQELIARAAANPEQFGPARSHCSDALTNVFSLPLPTRVR